RGVDRFAVAHGAQRCAGAEVTRDDPPRTWDQLGGATTCPGVRQAVKAVTPQFVLGGPLAGQCIRRGGVPDVRVKRGVETGDLHRTREHRPNVVQGGECLGLVWWGEWDEVV